MDGNADKVFLALFSCCSFSKAIRYSRLKLKCYFARGLIRPDEVLGEDAQCCTAPLVFNLILIKFEFDFNLKSKSKLIRP